MDPAAIALLASTTVNLLKPYLVKAGETAVQAVGQKLYDLLEAKLKPETPAKEAMEELKKAPDDADLQAQMRVQLKKMLAEDAELAAQIADITKEANETPAGATIISQTAGKNAIQFGQNSGQVTIKNK
jgi:hypothetical protein